jgi:hypothetical protein
MDDELNKIDSTLFQEALMFTNLSFSGPMVHEKKIFR